MATATLTASGNSLILTVPHQLVEQMQLHEGCEVTVEAADGRLLLGEPRYTLEQLLRECDPNAPISEEDIAWDRMKPVGRELI